MVKSMRSLDANSLYLEVALTSLFMIFFASYILFGAYEAFLHFIFSTPGTSVTSHLSTQFDMVKSHPFSGPGDCSCLICVWMCLRFEKFCDWIGGTWCVLFTNEIRNRYNPFSHLVLHVWEWIMSGSKSFFWNKLTFFGCYNILIICDSWHADI